MGNPQHPAQESLTVMEYSQEAVMQTALKGYISLPKTVK